MRDQDGNSLKNESPQNESTQNEGQASSPQFSMQRIYLKDLSFEAPQGAKAFQQQWKPQVNQDLSTKTIKLNDNHFEVVLSLTITVKHEDEVIYLVEVHQAGIFLIEGLEGPQLAQITNTHCPSILFPYAREVVDNVVTKGTFPALMLPPVNFDALFQQAVAQAKEKKGSQPSVH